MATQYTDLLQLALPVQGELTGTWGNTVNDEITQLLEEAIAGLTVINTWGANAHTLSVVQGDSSEARSAILRLTDTGGSLSGAAELICPDTSKIYLVENNTGQAVTVKTTAGSGVTIQDTFAGIVYCDGTNVLDAVNPTFYDNTTSGLTADTLSGAIDEVEARVQANEGAISTLQGRVTTVENETDTNTSDISTLQGTVGGLGTAATRDVTTSSTDATIGRVATFVNNEGIFGLGGTVGAPTADLNTISRTGVYDAPNGTANMPTTGANLVHFRMNAFNDNNGFELTGLTSSIATKAWIRSEGGAAYADWEELWHTGNLVKTTGSTDNTTGRVLVANENQGYFGIGGGDVPGWPNGTDLDNITNVATGIYGGFLSSVSTADGWPENATSINYTLAVYFEAQGSTPRATQQLTLIRDDGIITQRTFIRTLYSTSWQPWDELWHTGNLPITVDGSNNVTLPNRASIGATPSAADEQLLVKVPDLGTTAGDSEIALRTQSQTSNGSFLDVEYRRHTTGTSWTTSNVRLQHTIDASRHAFIDFAIDGQVGSKGLGFGNGNTTHLTVENNGDVNVKTGSLFEQGQRVYSPNNQGAGSGLDADRLDGFEGGAFIRNFAAGNTGTTELGRYIDFHTTGSTADFDIRLDCESANVLNVIGGGASGLEVNGSTVWNEGNLVKTTSPTDTTAGRVTQVGDAGWLTNSVAELNDFSTFIPCQVRSGGPSTPTDAPFNSRHVSLHLGSGTYGVQMGFNTNTTDSQADSFFQVRRFRGGAANSDWLKVWHTGNLTNPYSEANPNVETVEFGNSSTTKTRSAPITEVHRTGTASRTLTLATSGWQAGDVVKLRKVQTSGLWAVSFAGGFRYPDNSTDTSLSIPDGVSMSADLYFNGSTFQVTVLR